MSRRSPAVSTIATPNNRTVHACNIAFPRKMILGNRLVWAYAPTDFLNHWWSVAALRHKNVLDCRSLSVLHLLVALLRGLQCLSAWRWLPFRQSRREAIHRAVQIWKTHCQSLLALWVWTNNLALRSI